MAPIMAKANMARPVKLIKLISFDHFGLDQHDGHTTDSSGMRPTINRSAQRVGAQRSAQSSGQPSQPIAPAAQRSDLVLSLESVGSMVVPDQGSKPLAWISGASNGHVTARANLWIFLSVLLLTLDDQREGEPPGVFMILMGRDQGVSSCPFLTDGMPNMILDHLP
jgi:hypothetical protein